MVHYFLLLFSEFPCLSHATLSIDHLPKLSILPLVADPKLM